MGVITVSKPHPTVWQITITSPPDNRITTTLLAELGEALDKVEVEWRHSGGGAHQDPSKRGEYKGSGALILASGCGKFFSNGLDYEKSLTVDRFFENHYDPVMYRLLTFPLVTIAAVNGHAFAGGMILALACDYRIMTSGKGLVCMNEITFGSPLPNSFSALLGIRFPNTQDLRDTLLARRWTQAELLQRGILDEVVDDASPGKQGELLKKCIEVGVREGVKVGSGSWGSLKDGVYHSVQDASRSLRPLLFPRQEANIFKYRVGDKFTKGQAKL